MQATETPETISCRHICVYHLVSVIGSVSNDNGRRVSGQGLESAGALLFKDHRHNNNIILLLLCCILLFFVLARTSMVEGDTSLLSHVRLDMLGESLPETVSEACWKELEELSEVSPDPLETADPLARPDNPLPVSERTVAALLVPEIVSPGLPWRVCVGSAESLWRPVLLWRLVEGGRLGDARPSDERDSHSRSPATAAAHCERG